MAVAKVFTTGRSQAVRIPKQYRFTVSEVSVRRQGKNIILTPIAKPDALERFLAMPGVPDFTIEREAAQTVQARELF